MSGATAPIPTNGIDAKAVTVADTVAPAEDVLNRTGPTTGATTDALPSAAQTPAPAKAALQANGLGPLVRLRALRPQDLPAHATLAEKQGNGTAPQLSAFLLGVLTEGRAFNTDYLPSKFEVKGRDKSSPPSTAHVKLLAREIRAADLPPSAHGAASNADAEPENWFARESVHENAARSGTASWEEFDGGLRADHSQHEMDYTPTVFDVHEVLAWPVAAQVGGEDDAGEEPWTEVRAAVVEMAHRMPGPLHDRVFTVLVVTGKRREEFLTVQIPVDLTGVKGRKYGREGSKSNTVAGAYVSVEFCQLLEGGAKVKWVMGTASDAKGILPMWAQKMGVPGAVIKDVGLFIGWCDKRRQGKA